MFVLIESPYEPSASDVARYAGQYSAADLMRQNLVYARLALADALQQYGAAMAGHLLYGQIFDSSAKGRAGLYKARSAWAPRSDLCVLYTDLGMSYDMRLAAEAAELQNVDRVFRSVSTVLPAGVSMRDAAAFREALSIMDLATFPALETLNDAAFKEASTVAFTEAASGVFRVTGRNVGAA
jgi:hypothetical protein